MENLPCLLKTDDRDLAGQKVDCLSLSQPTFRHVDRNAAKQCGQTVHIECQPHRTGGNGSNQHKQKDRMS